MFNKKKIKELENRISDLILDKQEYEIKEHLYQLRVECNLPELKEGKKYRILDSIGDYCEVVERSVSFAICQYFRENRGPAWALLDKYGFHVHTGKCVVNPTEELKNV